MAASAGPTNRAKLLVHIATALDLVQCGASDRFARVEAPLTGEYIQFFAPDPKTFVGEAIGLANMRKLAGYHLSSVMDTKLPELGWLPPDPAVGGNWTRSWQSSNWNPTEVAELVLRIFETVYGLHHRALAVTVSPRGQIST